MKKYIVIALLLLVAVSVVYAATSIMPSDSPQAVVGFDSTATDTKSLPADTTTTYAWVATITGDAHGVLQLRVRAAGGWSGYVRLDSIDQAAGGIYVQRYASYTSDSLKHIWLPDRPKNPAFSALKRSQNYFAYQIRFLPRDSTSDCYVDISVE